MKNYLLSFALFLSVNYAQSAILRCNNNPAVTGVYASAQAAHDAASPGDTIHLEPTALGSYGSLSVSKQIVLIGTGDFLSQNQGIQSSSTPGYCDNIYLNTGCAGSVISTKVVGSIVIYENNISITHCHVNSIFINNNNVSNIFVQNNVISSSFVINSVCSNLIVTNNFVKNINMYNAQSSAVISYNVIFTDWYEALYNSSLFNNILIGNGGIPITFTNCSLTDNIDQYYSLPGGNNNVNNVDMSTVFTHWGSFDGDNYQLLPGSPYQNAGMFAGPTPYKLATTPAVPSIYHLAVPATSTGNNLNLNVSTRSNN